MVERSLQIFTAQTADGNSLAFNGNGIANIKISGTFDGASIDLQSVGTNANDAFSTTGDPAITEPSAWNIQYAPHIEYRLVVSGVGASTNINAFVSQ